MRAVRPVGGVRSPHAERHQAVLSLRSDGEAAMDDLRYRPATIGRRRRKPRRQRAGNGSDTKARS